MTYIHLCPKCKRQEIASEAVTCTRCKKVCTKIGFVPGGGLRAVRHVRQAKAEARAELFQALSLTRLQNALESAS